MIMWEYEERVGEQKMRSIPTVLKSAVVITGNDINDASVGWDQNQQAYVRLEFKPRGATTFCDISSENINKRFAIILDEEIKSAPVIRDRICGGVASIEMGAAIYRKRPTTSPSSCGQARWTPQSVLGRSEL